MNREKYDQEKGDLNDPAKPAWLPANAADAVESDACLLCGAPLEAGWYTDTPQETEYSCTECSWSCTVYEG